jgi:Raf kinase inhibitor-like YbhB/YbcL family protein
MHQIDVQMAKERRAAPSGLALLGAALALAGCGGSNARTATTPITARTAPVTIKLSSPAFRAGGTIPTRYACPGNTSPPLRWSGIPAGTRELALEMIDIDAPGGPFVHWALARIAPTSVGLRAGESAPPGALVGRNSAGAIGYYGPCPPPGKAHRYVITLLALKEASGLKPAFAAGALPTSRALAIAQLTGTYARS